MFMAFMLASLSSALDFQNLNELAGKNLSVLLELFGDDPAVTAIQNYTPSPTEPDDSVEATEQDKEKVRKIFFLSKTEDSEYRIITEKYSIPRDYRMDLSANENSRDYQIYLKISNNSGNLPITIDKGIYRDFIYNKKDGTEIAQRIHISYPSKYFKSAFIIYPRSDSYDCTTQAEIPSKTLLCNVDPVMDIYKGEEKIASLFIVPDVYDLAKDPKYGYVADYLNGRNESPQTEPEF